ncbi:MAG: hypothetical protein HC853_08900 [Anaerolineae bacterium]|nr:hypothetical protein [Anaerolineae bacterium]
MTTASESILSEARLVTMMNSEEKMRAASKDAAQCVVTKLLCESLPFDCGGHLIYKFVAVSRAACAQGA